MGRVIKKVWFIRSLVYSCQERTKKSFSENRQVAVKCFAAKLPPKPPNCRQNPLALLKRRYRQVAVKCLAATVKLPSNVWRLPSRCRELNKLRLQTRRLQTRRLEVLESSWDPPLTPFGWSSRLPEKETKVSL